MLPPGFALLHSSRRPPKGPVAAGRGRPYRLILMKDDDLIILVRHGLAQESHRAGDGARGLTEEGRRKFRKQAQRLARKLSIRMIVSSPLVRAVQTAELLAEACGLDSVEIHESLSPGPNATSRTLKLIDTLPRGTAVVGHNPSLEEVAGRLLHQTPLPYDFKKGAAYAIRRESGGGQLALYLTPGRKPVRP